MEKIHHLNKFSIFLVHSVARIINFINSNKKWKLRFVDQLCKLLFLCRVLKIPIWMNIKTANQYITFIPNCNFPSMYTSIIHEYTLTLWSIFFSFCLFSSPYTSIYLSTYQSLFLFSLLFHFRVLVYYKCHVYCVSCCKLCHYKPFKITA